MLLIPNLSGVGDQYPRPRSPRPRSTQPSPPPHPASLPASLLELALAGARVPHQKHVHLAADAGAAAVLPLHPANQHQQRCQLHVEEAVQLGADAGHDLGPRVGWHRWWEWERVRLRWCVCEVGGGGGTAGTGGVNDVRQQGGSRAGGGVPEKPTLRARGSQLLVRHAGMPGRACQAEQPWRVSPRRSTQRRSSHQPATLAPTLLRPSSGRRTWACQNWLNAWAASAVTSTSALRSLAMVRWVACSARLTFRQGRRTCQEQAGPSKGRDDVLVVCVWVGGLTGWGGLGLGVGGWGGGVGGWKRNGSIMYASAMPKSGRAASAAVRTAAGLPLGGLRGPCTGRQSASSWRACCAHLAAHAGDQGPKLADHNARSLHLVCTSAGGGRFVRLCTRCLVAGPWFRSWCLVPEGCRARCNAILPEQGIILSGSMLPAGGQPSGSQHGQTEGRTSNLHSCVCQVIKQQHRERPRAARARLLPLLDPNLLPVGEGGHAVVVPAVRGSRVRS